MLQSKVCLHCVLFCTCRSHYMYSLGLTHCTQHYNFRAHSTIIGLMQRANKGACTKRQHKKCGKSDYPHNNQNNYTQVQLHFTALSMSFLHAVSGYSCMFHFHFPQLDVVIHLPLLMAVSTTLIVHKKE